MSYIPTSASTHGSQVAITLGEMTSRRISNCYDLMGSAYDSPQIHEHSRRLGHVQIIDTNPRRNKLLKEELTSERKRRNVANHTIAEKVRYSERSTVERANGRLKDEFGGCMVRVRGHAKVICHLMFGMVALTANQLMCFIE